MTPGGVRDLGSLNLPDCGLHRGGPGAGHGPRLFAQRHHHLRRPFPQFHARIRGALFFLLSTPAIAGAAAKALWDMHKHGGGLHPS